MKNKFELRDIIESILYTEMAIFLDLKTVKGCSHNFTGLDERAVAQKLALHLDEVFGTSIFNRPAFVSVMQRGDNTAGIVKSIVENFSCKMLLNSYYEKEIRDRREKRDATKAEIVIGILKRLLFSNTVNLDEKLFKDVPEELREKQIDWLIQAINYFFTTELSPKDYYCLVYWDNLMDDIINQGSFEQFESSKDIVWSVFDEFVFFYVWNAFSNTYICNIQSDKVSQDNRAYLKIDTHEDFHYIYNLRGSISEYIVRCFAITDRGIYFKQKSNYWNDRKYIDIDIAIAWKDISRVEYREGKYCFYTYKENQKYFLVDATHAVESEVHSHRIAFAEMLDRVAKLDRRPRITLELNDVLNKQTKLFYDEKYDEVIDLTDDYLSKATSDIFLIQGVEELFLKKAIAADYKEPGAKMAIQAIDKALEIAINNEAGEKKIIRLRCWRGKFLHRAGELNSARNELIYGLNEQDEDFKQEVFEYFETCDKDFTSTFLEKEYRERKLLMPVKRIDGCVTETNNINVFRIDNLPDIQFNIGHPQLNTVYIGHPFVPSIYIPLFEHEQQLFFDRVDELCYLLQYLGAEEISITSLKGKTVQESGKKLSNIKAELGVKASKTNTDIDNQRSTANDTQSERKAEIVQHFAPKYSPYVPDGLIWYPKEARWKHIVIWRTQGSQLSFQEKLSSKEISCINEAEVQNINAEVKFLLSKASANVKNENENEYRTSEETEWEISVRFAPIESLSGTAYVATPLVAAKELPTSPQLPSEAHEQYRQEVLFCLEDDEEISRVERRFLDKKRQELGLSEEVATEIEAAVLASAQYTDDENEYIEMLKEVLAEGEISDKDRRILNRFCNSLGIDTERAAQLEQLVLTER